MARLEASKRKADSNFVLVLLTSVVAASPRASVCA